MVAVSHSMNQTRFAPTGPTSGGQDNYQPGNRSRSSEISPQHNCASRQLKALLGSCEVSGLPQAPALEGDSPLLLLGFWSTEGFLLFQLCIIVASVSSPFLMMALLRRCMLFGFRQYFIRYCHSVNFLMRSILGRNACRESGAVRNGGNVEFCTIYVVSATRALFT